VVQRMRETFSASHSPEREYPEELPAVGKQDYVR
jgi:hypothetical protein